MYTSDIDNEKKRMLRHAVGNLLFAGFCALFGGIYEAFSFGVFSFYMIYAFAFPLAGGILLLIMYAAGKVRGRLFLNLCNSANATAAVGFLAAGVVEIYGTENRLLAVYTVLAALLFAASAAVLAAEVLSRRRVQKRLMTAQQDQSPRGV